MFGLTVMIAEVPRVLGASDNLVSTFDTIAGIFGVTTVYMIVRCFFMLCRRGAVLLFRRGRPAPEPRRSA